MAWVALSVKAKCCDCCKNFLISGSRFRSAATGKEFKIDKSLACTSANIVYLAQCVSCGLQGVGSSIDFSKHLANYKSHIKCKHRTFGLLTIFYIVLVLIIRP